MTIPEDFHQILSIHDQWIQLRYEHWLANEAYTGMWWVMVVLWIVPWVIWLAIVDRKRIVCLSFYGLKVLLGATFLDAIGTMQTRWLYTVKVIPFVPHLDPVDWSIIPILNMLIYQYFPAWKPFLTIQILVAALFAFVGEPLTIYTLGIYVPIKWEHIYSFPLYFLLGVLPRLSTEYLYRLEQRSKK